MQKKWTSNSQQSLEPPPSFFNARLVYLLGLILIMSILYWGISQKQIRYFKHKHYQSRKIITTLPVSFFIASFLTKGTPLQVEYVASEPSLDHQKLWFSQYVYKEKEHLSLFDACFSVRTLWRDDPLIRYARQEYPRLVEIDMTGDGYDLFVEPVEISKQSYSPYIWLSFYGLRTMIKESTRLLSKTYPDHATKIRENSQMLDQSLWEAIQLLNRSYSQLREQKGELVLGSIAYDSRYLMQGFPGTVYVYSIEEWRERKDLLSAVSLFLVPSEFSVNELMQIAPDLPVYSYDRLTNLRKNATPEVYLQKLSEIHQQIIVRLQSLSRDQ